MGGGKDEISHGTASLGGWGSGSYGSSRYRVGRSDLMVIVAYLFIVLRDVCLNNV